MYFLARIGEEKDLPGLSCKDINECQENSPSGEYWIDPSNINDPFTVFCDMQTDRGKTSDQFILASKLQLQKLQKMKHEKSFRFRRVPPRY